MPDNIIFWLWHKEIAGRMNHPVTAFLWRCQVEAVYKPLFRKSGLQAVFDEHARYVKCLRENLDA